MNKLYSKLKLISSNAKCSKVNRIIQSRVGGGAVLYCVIMVALFEVIFKSRFEEREVSQVDN